jgi:putative chitinase
MTPEQLIKISPYAKYKAVLYSPLITAAMQEFDINTKIRQAAFIAQILHESGSLRYVQELASGEDYEGRKVLGNTHTGDGRRFKGRGLIQITGRINYTAVMLALNLDCLEKPELLELPENACRTTAWWWREHDLNEMADLNTEESFIKITKRINGGTNHLKERQDLWKQAKIVLGV